MSYSNEINKCPIWPSCPARGNRNELRSIIFVEDSLRAGGSYQITYLALESLGNASEKEKALLTTILLDQREQGIEYPVVNAALVEKGDVPKIVEIGVVLHLP